MGSFSLMHWLIVLLIIALTFLPSWIAFRRKLRKRVAILVLNILLGWTGVGWMVLLIWSILSDDKDPQLVIR